MHMEVINLQKSFFTSNKQPVIIKQEIVIACCLSHDGGEEGTQGGPMGNHVQHPQNLSSTLEKREIREL